MEKEKLEVWDFIEKFYPKQDKKEIFDYLEGKEKIIDGYVNDKPYDPKLFKEDFKNNIDTVATEFASVLGVVYEKSIESFLELNSEIFPHLKFKN